MKKKKTKELLKMIGNNKKALKVATDAVQKFNVDNLLKKQWKEFKRGELTMHSINKIPSI